MKRRNRGSLYMSLIGSSIPYKVVEHSKVKRKNEARKERRKSRELSGECVVIYRKPDEDVTS